MSHSEPLGVNYKIPIGAAIGRAYRMVFQNLRLVCRFTWLPFAVLLVIFSILYLIPTVPVLDHPFLWCAQVLGSALIELLALLGGIMLFLARWYRFAILGEDSTEIFPPRGSLFVKAAIEVSAVLLIAYVGFGVVNMLSAFLNGGFAADLLILILIFGAPFFVIEVSLIFPAAVVGRRLALGAAWALLAGNHVRLLATILLAYLPFLAIQMAIFTIEPTDFSPKILGFLVPVALFVASWFPFAAIAAVLLCEVYRATSGGAANRAAAG